MIYLVFKETRFIGHTDSKKIIKKLLKQKKTKYTVEEVDERFLNDDLRTMDEFDLRKFNYYEEHDRVLTQLQLILAHSVVQDRLLAISKAHDALDKLMNCVKLDKEEEGILKTFRRLTRMIREDLTGSESSVFLRDYFDMDSIIDLIMGDE